MSAVTLNLSGRKSNMLSEDALRREAASFISGQLEIPFTGFSSNAELKGMGMDSFRIIELVLFLERKTGMTFPDSAYTPQNLKSVDSIVTCFLKLEK